MPDDGSKRGRTHDAEGAREAILNAAEQVFAEHGFDGARIDAIAKAAGYNKSLIFQYYGDKLKLYAAVIERADEQTRWMQNEALPGLLEATEDPGGDGVRNVLRGLIGRYFDYLLEHPRILRVFLWEMAEGWQTWAKIISQRDYDDMALFGPILEKLKGKGLFRSERLNPMVQVFSAMFAVHNFLGMFPVNHLFFPDEDLSSPEAMAQAREHIIEFVVHGLMNDPVGPKA
jgi:AcrR family transcriptional regulator